MDLTRAEFHAKLHEIAKNSPNKEEITRIAAGLDNTTNDLLADHEKFVLDFDTQLSDRDVAQSDLQKLLDSYLERRSIRRREMLRWQQELHDSLSPEEWSEMVHLLNRAVETGLQRVLSTA